MEKEYCYRLIKEAQSGNKQAEEALIKENSGLVRCVAGRFQGRGHEPDDLFQVGCFGLLNAIRRFDVNYDVKFSTYAVPLILGEIKRYVRDQTPIKLSRSTKELYFKIQKLREGNEKLTVGDIAEALETSEEKVLYALEAFQKTVSLNETDCAVSDAERISQLADPKDEMGEVLSSVMIKGALSRLNERERKIILLRYMKDCTQSTIAEKLGISQVQVSRLEKKILMKLHEELRFGSES